MLICPKCKQDLIQKNASYECINAHHYDLSKEGYLHLMLANQKKHSPGDDKNMIAARSAFLNKGYYEPLRTHLETIFSPYLQNSSVLLDLGCGEGYYTNHLYHFITSIYSKISMFGLDISKTAVRKAAKKSQGVLYLCASGANIPLRSQSTHLCYGVFSPYFDHELSRILTKNGIYIGVQAGRNHLYELKNQLYSNIRIHETEPYNLPSFSIVGSSNLLYDVTIQKDDISSLLQMTPYFHTTNPSDIERIKQLNSLTTPIHFVCTIYQKRE